MEEARHHNPEYLKMNEKTGHWIVVGLCAVVLPISLYVHLWPFVGWSVVAGATSSHRLLAKRGVDKR